QYFPDVEGAVLEIAEEVAKEGAGLTELVAGRSWVGKAGWTTSEQLVEGFLGFWRHNDAILRVIDLGAAEGDKRFYKIRMKILNSVTNSLTDSVKELQSKGKVDKDVSPAA
ncbi:TetR/AcrR family transcriptional regulator, partial [Streptomyces sp. SID7499]|nr:TetR/AcrR family transcriptional regulator [Streptomyces sp. SID7499]